MVVVAAMKPILLSILMSLCMAMLSAAPRANADCFEEAGAYQHVSATVLRAIAWQESHNRAGAVHRNTNGSVDYGVMQINSVHLTALARYGISKAMLMEACTNIYVAAWHLRQKINKYGNTWTAVGAYHSEARKERDDYAMKIASLVARWSASASSPNQPVVLVAAVAD